MRYECCDTRKEILSLRRFLIIDASVHRKKRFLEK